MVFGSKVSPDNRAASAAESETRASRDSRLRMTAVGAVRVQCDVASKCVTTVIRGKDLRFSVNSALIWAMVVGVMSFLKSTIKGALCQSCVASRERKRMKATSGVDGTSKGWGRT